MRRTSSPLRVLVADDSTDVAQRVCEQLRETGQIEVIGPAENGKAALMLFVDEKPDAIVLDFAMPQMNGIEVIRTIRSLGYPGLAIILTAHHDSAIAEACHKAGADHLLHKASDFERLPELLLAFGKSRRV